MARDILGDFGRDSGAGQKPRATNGGVQPDKTIPYSPPQGPSNQYHEAPGLDGDNHGTCGTQGKH